MAEAVQSSCSKNAHEHVNIQEYTDLGELECNKRGANDTYWHAIIPRAGAVVMINVDEPTVTVVKIFWRALTGIIFDTLSLDHRM